MPAASSTSEDPPWDSATSPTTSPDPCWKPADSNPNYTAIHEEPVYHYREDRIRAHVQLCWLALLLIRVAETTAGDTWPNLRHELDRIHLVTFATANGRVAQRSALTGDQKTALAALDLPEPPRYLDFTHPAPTPTPPSASPSDRPARITGLKPGRAAKVV